MQTIENVHLVDCFPQDDEYVDGHVQMDNIKSFFRFKELISQNIIDMMISTAGQSIAFDSLVTPQQTAKQVEECGLDGHCTSNQCLT